MKPVFFESRDANSNVWQKFCTAAKSEKGALLCAVVGGKLSEGNFDFKIRFLVPKMALEIIF